MLNTICVMIDSLREHPAIGMISGLCVAGISYDAIMQSIGVTLAALIAIITLAIKGMDFWDKFKAKKNAKKEKNRNIC